MPAYFGNLIGQDCEVLTHTNRLMACGQGKSAVQFFYVAPEPAPNPLALAAPFMAAALCGDACDSRLRVVFSPTTDARSATADLDANATHPDHANPFDACRGRSQHPRRP